MFFSIRMRHYEIACLCQYYLSLFLSPPYPLSLKRIGDKVIMLCFSVRQEPFAVTGLLNVFLLRWGLCAVEPQWTELLMRKKEKCSFWTTCSMNHLSCGNHVICISPATAGGLLMNPGMTDCLERSRVGPDVRIGFLSIHEQELQLNWPCFTGGWIGIWIRMTGR